MSISLANTCISGLQQATVNKLLGIAQALVKDHIRRLTRILAVDKYSAISLYAQIFLGDCKERDVPIRRALYLKERVLTLRC